jgi:hypothetical protein
MENVVTKGAAQAEPMHKLSTGIAPGQTGSWEDLGGPTPENYKSDDDSAKLKDPATTLAQVKNIVNAKAAKADAMQKLAAGAVKEETEEDEEDLIAEEEVTEAMEEDEDEEEETPKKKKKGGKEEAEDEDEDEMKKEEYNIEEDVNALLSGEELSEEFQEKARTIFETAIKSKVAEIKEELQAQYEESLVEEIVAIKEELTDRVDSYLEYVADEWVAENALAVEAVTRLSPYLLGPELNV